MLCETWVTKDMKELVTIPGYDFVGIEQTNEKGGGVGLLIVNELKYKIRKEYSKMTDHMECFVVELITRVTKSSATLIDYIFVSCKIQNQVHSSVIIHDISNHFPSLLILQEALANKREPKIIAVKYWQ